jgi:hypothetical protein
MKNILKSIYRFLLRIAIVLRNAPFVGSVSNAPCYFREKKRKGACVRYIDNFVWLIKKGEKNRFYTQYGLDIKGSISADYIGFWEFAGLRNKSNQILRFDNSIGILRDKFLFYKYMAMNRLNVPDVFAIASDGVVYDVFFSPVSIQSLEQEKDYFVKDVAGECASFVKHVNDYNHLQTIIPLMDKGKFIFQRKIIQHHEMNRLNPSAVNTIRIVTINDGVSTHLFAAILRVGTKKSGCADNTSAGGIALGIKDDGFLFDKGMLKPQYGTLLSAHPDTGVVFSKFKIPYYEDAVKLVCHAHKFFYNVRSIGWDVAISEKGPIIIEGNDNWEITSIQAIYGGKKRQLTELMGNC